VEESDKKVHFKLIDYIRGNKSYVLNILVMMVNWSCSSFCFYLIPYFLSNLNAEQLGASSLNVFQLSLAQYTGELFACVFSVMLARYVSSSKLSLSFCHALSITGALLYILSPSSSVYL
jgi:Na+/melibiose symporter-like transporter